LPNLLALTVDPVSDQERGANEWRELTRMVEEVFARPGDREPAISRHLRRARLQLEEKASFGNYRLGVVWGPADRTDATVPIRRLIWRRDVDGNRGDPIARLRRLGSDLMPTIEVADSTPRLDELKAWVEAVPVSSEAARRITDPRSIGLDGNRCSVSLEAGDSAWKHEWFAIGTDWQPTDRTYEALANWAMELRDRLEAALG